jgi:5'-methylthioadenosine phosphorylase
MLGVIGGSGLYDLPDLKVLDEVAIETPFGKPSDRLLIGRVASVEIAFLARHGSGHQHAPSNVPYRANVYAMKQVGVTHLLSVSAVGSLREEIAPRAMVLPDQIIDRTSLRKRSFFDEGVVAHVGLADPFCACLRASLFAAGETANVPLVREGTYLCIEGPQFSTRAESRLFRDWGASVIGMTAMPEARLAREAELCYATVAMVTDYDVWHDVEAAVSIELVIAHLTANVAVGHRLVRALVAAGLPARSCACGNALRDAIITAPEAISADVTARLGVVASRYLAAPVAPVS